MKLSHFHLSVWLLALQSQQISAFWRMACSVAQTARADPILNPGTVAGHVHKFAGAINVDENSTFDSLSKSGCSTCEVQHDMSAYWTPQLYYAHSNGSFQEVDNDGMTVYYVEQHYMFRTDCVNGMRAQLNFQSCWDGVNLYLPNSSHVAYLSGIDYGVCPPSHPVPIPGLFFEVLYWTNRVDQSKGGEFVFSNGDTTGYGFHGDFMNGWKHDVQVDAVQNCLYTDNGGLVSNCASLAASDDVNFARTCPQAPSIFNEPASGMLDALPGCNPVTSGPGIAPQQVCPLNSHSLGQVPVSPSSGTSTLSTTSFSQSSGGIFVTVTSSTVPASSPNVSSMSGSSPSQELSSSTINPSAAPQPTSPAASQGSFITVTVTAFVTITATPSGNGQFTSPQGNSATVITASGTITTVPTSTITGSSATITTPGNAQSVANGGVTTTYSGAPIVISYPGGTVTIPGSIITRVTEPTPGTVVAAAFFQVSSQAGAEAKVGGGWGDWNGANGQPGANGQRWGYPDNTVSVAGTLYTITGSTFTTFTTVPVANPSSSATLSADMPSAAGSSAEPTTTTTMFSTTTITVTVFPTSTRVGRDFMGGDFAAGARGMRTVTITSQTTIQTPLPSPSVSFLTAANGCAMYSDISVAGCPTTDSNSPAMPQETPAVMPRAAAGRLRGRQMLRALLEHI